MRDSATGRPYVFISYASADRDRVLSIVDRLEAAGVRTWIDRDGIHGGANYAQVINDAVEGSAAFVLLASPASLSSRNVKQELALGWRYEKAYVPLLLDAVSIPGELAYWLEGSQWIELLGRSEQDWLADIAKALQPHSIVMTPDSQVQPRAIRERPLLVGREREQAMLRAQLDRMLEGQGGTILVGGEAGIGKTTLVEDLSIDAEDQGALVLWGHAYDLSVTPPYGPWLEIFRQYRSLADAALPTAPAFLFDVDELAAVGSQNALFVAVAELLEALAAERSVILVVDDLHWVDQASLDFFRFLARRVASCRILLVATYRSDELHRRHPLYTVLPLLVREAGAKRIDVRALDEVGHRALIQSRYALVGADQEQLERYLVAHAEGNPLYAGELLRTLEEEGLLVRRADTWQLGDLDQARIPSLLMQVIEGRVARFDEESQRLLGIASVIGQTVQLNVWARAGGVEESELLDVAERAEEAQLIAEASTGGSVQFRHALIREALYEGIPALRRRRLHRQVGEAVTEISNPDPDIVAYHFQQAGDRRAAEWLIKAGLRAEAAFVLRTAAERFDAAHALLEDDSAQVESRGWLLYRLAFVKRFSAPSESLTSLDEVQALAEQAGNLSMKIVAQADRGFVLHMLGKVDESLGTEVRDTGVRLGVA
ncbi:MAG: AAA family ATPase [Nitrolancea sp.]